MTDSTSEELKTSLEWYLLRDNKRVVLLNPYGWGLENFEHSWTEELITKEEYERRLGLSDCFIQSL